MKFTTQNILLIPEYLKVAGAVAKKANTAMPTLRELKSGKMECYRYELVNTGNAYDNKKVEIPVKFPYTSIEYTAPPYRMRRSDATRKRSGWQIVTFDLAEFVDWLNGELR